MRGKAVLLAADEERDIEKMKAEINQQISLRSQAYIITDLFFISTGSCCLKKLSAFRVIFLQSAFFTAASTLRLLSSVGRDSLCLNLVFSLTASHQKSFETFSDFITAQRSDERSVPKK